MELVAGGGYELPDTSVLPVALGKSNVYNHLQFAANLRCWNVREQRLDFFQEHFARKPGWLRRCIPRAAGFRSSLRAKKYQFVTRSGSGPNFWVFKARSPRMNVGFLNRYKTSLKWAEQISTSESAAPFTIK
jgi:hypothetical protein